jgi:hypothetical protein
VDVGLAVGNQQDLVAAQVFMQDGAQRLRVPAHLRLVAHAPLAVQFAHQGLQVARDRLELGRVRRARARAAVAADHGFDAAHQAAHRDLRDHH